LYDFYHHEIFPKYCFDKHLFFSWFFSAIFPKFTVFKKKEDRVEKNSSKVFGASFGQKKQSSPPPPLLSRGAFFQIDF